MLLPAREAYSIWAPEWDATPSPIVSLESRHLQPLIGDPRGKRLIDCGCGTGRWLTWARDRGAEVVGVDFSAEMLARARGKQGLEGRLAAGDTTRLPVRTASADIVLCTLMLGHTREPQMAIAELARIARPGAVILITDFHPEAARRGWKRTFSSGGRVYEVENFPYGLGDLCHDALELTEVRDLYFDEPERPIFERAGKGAEFEAARAIPAVLLIRWRRL